MTDAPSDRAGRPSLDGGCETDVAMLAYARRTEENRDGFGQGPAPLPTIARLILRCR